MTTHHAVSKDIKRMPRWRTKLFGPKILRIRRRALVRRNVSDVMQTLRSLDTLTQTFAYLRFRKEGSHPPRSNISIFANEESGRKGLDLIAARADDGVMFRTSPEALTDIDGEVTCRALDIATTEVRLALGLITPMTGLRALGAPLTKSALDRVVRDELRRLKQFIETGEVAKAA